MAKELFLYNLKIKDSFHAMHYPSYVVMEKCPQDLKLHFEYYSL
jgi:hypothetical protein